MAAEPLGLAEILQDVDSRMTKSVDVLKRELNSVRTSRATPALVENVAVDYYGVPTPMNQLATISAPDAQLILIHAFDPQSLHDIERSLLKANLGLNPASDGTIIRIPIPPLTQERRKELVRSIGSKVEEGKVAVRNIRRDVLEQLRAKERNKDISKDESQRAQGQLQKTTDAHIAQIDQSWQSKVADMMKV